MGPTVPLSRLIFEPPTYHYKVGVAFLAWLNGLQPHFAMLGGLQRQRPAEAPDPALRAGRGRPGADRPGPGRRADGRDAGSFGRTTPGPAWRGVTGLDRLSLNQATVQHLDVAEAVDLCVRHDIPAIGLWRDRVAETGLAEAAATVRAAGLHVSSLCRGGFFTHGDPDGRRVAVADNLAAIAEAAELGTDTLVLVCGGLVPGSGTSAWPGA